ncbi:uncharacterized protein LOC108682641 [Hyalella azteca]|uniref:Uncharacterized protein LOC108682641 n=1 Tax=Hyalella azteca TaxID=294128 RepID=A0A8B7PPW6_HYAAZ|nr:uncharacterized protein LOC108682641 [Hyalella azteca]
MYKVSLFVVFGLAVVAVRCEAEATAEAEADPAILVSQHRRSHTHYPGYVVQKAEHIPGFGFQKLKAYQPAVAVKSYDTSHTLYPDPILPAVKYVHYVSPSLHSVPDYYANADYYGGSGYYGGAGLYGVHNYLPHDKDLFY